MPDIRGLMPEEDLEHYDTEAYTAGFLVGYLRGMVNPDTREYWLARMKDEGVSIVEAE